MTQAAVTQVGATADSFTASAAAASASAAWLACAVLASPALGKLEPACERPEAQNQARAAQTLAGACLVRMQRKLRNEGARARIVRTDGKKEAESRGLVA